MIPPQLHSFSSSFRILAFHHAQNTSKYLGNRPATCVKLPWSSAFKRLGASNPCHAVEKEELGH